MDRKERLRQLLAGRSGPAPPAAAAADAAGAPPPDLAPRVTRYPLKHRHGDVPLAAGSTISYNLMRLAGLDGLETGYAGRMLLLDTETTGLAGGTGTTFSSWVWPTARTTSWWCANTSCRTRGGKNRSWS